MPETRPGRSAGRTIRRAGVPTAALLSIVALATLMACSDSLVTAEPQVSLWLSPDLAAVPELAQLGGEVIDSVYVVLRSPIDDRSYAVGRHWPPDQSQIELAVDVEVRQSEEPFDFVFEMWAGTELVLVSEGSLTVTRSGTTDASEVVTANFRPAGTRALAASLAVAGPGAPMRSGETFHLAATVRDSAGEPMEDAPVAWESLSPEVAGIDADGLVTAGRVPAGVALIRAFVPYTTVADTIELAVLAAGIVVVPAADTAHAVGDTLTFTASGLDVDGAAMDGVVPVSWSHGDPGVELGDPDVAEIVGTDGSSVTLRALAEGEMVVVATFDPDPELTATARVVVAQLVASVTIDPASASFAAHGDTLRFTATAADARGNVLVGRPITWASLDPAVVEIDGGGLATAHGNGSTHITATVNGVADTVAVVVDAAMVSVTVRSSVGARAAIVDLRVDGTGLMEPIEVAMTVADGTAEATVELPAGSDAVFDVEARDADFVLYALGSATAVVDPDGETDVDVVLVNITGQVTVRAEVPAHVTAASVEASGFAIATTHAEMTIASGMASVTLNLPVGASREFVVTAFDENGIAVRRGSATSAVVEGDPAAVDVTLGTVEGDQPIVATFGSFTLILSPGDRTAGVGETIDYTATVLDQDGNEVPDAEVTWASSNPAIAQVDGDGRVTTKARGETRIAISHQGFGISALLTVGVEP